MQLIKRSLSRNGHLILLMIIRYKLTTVTDWRIGDQPPQHIEEIIVTAANLSHYRSNNTIASISKTNCICKADDCAYRFSVSYCRRSVQFPKVLVLKVKDLSFVIHAPMSIFLLRHDKKGRNIRLTLVRFSAFGLTPL